MSAEAKNLKAIVRALEHHDATCEFPATAVALNPFELDRLGWDSIRGVPLIADPKLGTGSFRVLCDKPKAPGQSAEQTTSVPIRRPEPVEA